MRLSDILQKACRFGASGLMVTACHVFMAYSLISHFKASPALANGVAFAISAMISYGLNTLWSFSASASPRNFQRFLIVTIAGCLLASLIARVAEAHGLPYYQGILLIILLVTPITFLLHLLWTYRWVKEDA